MHSEQPHSTATELGDAVLEHFQAELAGRGIELEVGVLIAKLAPNGGPDGVLCGAGLDARDLLDFLLVTVRAIAELQGLEIQVIRPENN